MELFLVLAVATSISVTSWYRDWSDVLKVPILILLRHLFYGWGMLTGFFYSIPRPVQEVKVFRVRWTNNNYRLIPASLGKILSKGNA